MILGSNGAGKTSLLKAIVGLYKVNKGSILVNNFDVTRGKKLNLLSTNLESVYHLGSLNIGQTYSVYSEAFNCVKDAGNLYNLVRPKGDTLSRLSTGEKKWFTTVLALFAGTEVTLLDEPFEDLDPALVKSLVNAVLSVKGKQLIITLHSIHLLKYFKDWDLFFMFNGKLYGKAKVEDVLDSCIVSGDKENSVLKVSVGGMTYSIVKGDCEGGISLKEINNLDILYDRLREEI
ncbi:ATP-binding cassette domain-containing protein [Sulfuracidifex tepidarius]|uniref:Vitamin B12 import ATP-binding protein BtuD n=1 Tax=Sulfuracidifex tepidarius TaxID=1294262 RepID=A0A510E5N8_9CREN|nr:ABC transporter ATP-binding protein [Sulfuracidifex tepidarius]BBG24964.1 Vitamin B12 import ATP-binding protein BtuD [Sulfuracidifex tepidarius]BBG27747.1 Vitamin B12 import ATP-binding protein BtuD [Sulfuracidifex tepidarius]